MTDHIREALRFDPLATAEKLTGQSYKEDPGTSALGMLMAIDHDKRKTDLLKTTDDTYYSIDFASALRIYRELGFEVIWENKFAGREVEETYLVLWRPDGVLAFMESYRGGDLNNTKFWYNIRFREGIEHGSYVSSGGFHASVWCGDHDGREGLRHNLSRLESAGEFVTPWVKAPFLWFRNYAQTEDYKTVNAAVIGQFPAEVQSAIGGV